MLASLVEQARIRILMKRPNALHAGVASLHRHMVAALALLVMREGSQVMLGATIANHVLRVLFRTFAEALSASSARWVIILLDMEAVLASSAQMVSLRGRLANLNANSALPAALPTSERVLARHVPQVVLPVRATSNVKNAASSMRLLSTCARLTYGLSLVLLGVPWALY